MRCGWRSRPVQAPPRGRPTFAPCAATSKRRGGSTQALTRSYREALAISPGFGAAAAGLALSGPDRGRQTDLRRRSRRCAARSAIRLRRTRSSQLGEVEQAAGRLEAAAPPLRAGERDRGTALADGAGYDAGVTLNEAEHGDSAQAVVYGRRAWRSAPSVSSADAYSWALYRDGRIAAAGRLSGRR